MWLRWQHLSRCAVLKLVRVGENHSSCQDTIVRKQADEAPSFVLRLTFYAQNRITPSLVSGLALT